MNNWKFIIDVSEIWGKAHDVGIEKFKKKFYEILKSYNTKIEKTFGENILLEYKVFLDILKGSEYKDFNEFDEWLKIFYNFINCYKIGF